MTYRHVEPVEAATLILVRAVQGAGGWECLMLRRHALSDFAADVFVFPGGRVDDHDYLTGPVAHPDTEISHGLAPPWSTLMQFRVAAIREAFEEAGILLAWNTDGEMVSFDTPESREKYSDYRRMLNEGTHRLFFVTEQETIRLAVDRLYPFSHWITPSVLPKRFDTYFFVALSPEGQEPLHDALETVDMAWISPEAALQRYRAGEFPLVFATEKNLESLARFNTIEALIDGCRSADLTPIEPRPVMRDGERAFLIPGDAGYEEAASGP